MKIINANAGYLTNAEVFDLLREQAPSVEENKYELYIFWVESFEVSTNSMLLK